jgi:hypothetical protein
MRSKVSTSLLTRQPHLGLSGVPGCRIGNGGQSLAINGVDEDQFKQILKSNLTPARAISSPEHLKRRARALLQIGRAFNSPGKHIFIHGAQGVSMGKSKPAHIRRPPWNKRRIS